MEVGGDDQYAADGLVGETVCDIVSFGSSRKAPNRANADRSRIGKALDVPLRKVNLHRVVNLCLCRNINYNARSESFVQKLQSMRGALIGLTSQHDNDVGRFRSINNKNSSGIACEQSEAGEQDQDDNPSSSADVSVHERGGLPKLSQFGHSRPHAGSCKGRRTGFAC